jgi:hypothetical protein
MGVEGITKSIKYITHMYANVLSKQLLVTDIGGEWRLASSVAQRAASLGECKQYIS